MRGLRVRYLEVDDHPAHDGRVLAPTRWEGEMRSRRGVFRYTARASTPVAALVPGGGMLGFEFDGEWSARDGGSAVWSGVGFCEYGDFPGNLKPETVPARVGHRVPACET